MEELNMYQLQEKAASGAELDDVEKLRLELYEKSTHWVLVRRAWAA